MIDPRLREYISLPPHSKRHWTGTPLLYLPDRERQFGCSEWQFIDARLSGAVLRNEEAPLDLHAHSTKPQSAQRKRQGVFLMRIIRRCRQSQFILHSVIDNQPGKVRRERKRESKIVDEGHEKGSFSVINIVKSAQGRRNEVQDTM